MVIYATGANHAIQLVDTDKGCATDVDFPVARDILLVMVRKSTIVIWFLRSGVGVSLSLIHI